MKRHWSAGLFWLAVLVLTLSGCFFRAPADLYQSPEQSADYLSLTQTIRNAKNALSQEYGVEVEDISVMSGNNTALIQLQDMDGDGTTETAVTFFRVPDADRPLKIYFSPSRMRILILPARWWRGPAPPSTGWTMWT